MSHVPPYKIFNPSGEYVACTKYLEDAACLIASLGDGSQIRWGHDKRYTVWTEGKEKQPAAESYDFVRITAEDKIAIFIDEIRERQ